MKTVLEEGTVSRGSSRSKNQSNRPDKLSGRGPGSGEIILNGTIDLHKQQDRGNARLSLAFLDPATRRTLKRGSTPGRVFYPCANPSPTRGIPQCLERQRMERGEERATLLHGACPCYQGVTSWYTSLTTLLPSLPFLVSFLLRTSLALFSSSYRETF